MGLSRLMSLFIVFPLFLSTLVHPNSFCLLFNPFLCVFIVFSSLLIVFCAYSNADFISLFLLPRLSCSSAVVTLVEKEGSKARV